MDWHFDVREEQDGRSFVEVPLSAALEDEALAWVMDGARAGRYRRAAGGSTNPDGSRGTVNVVLVPWDDYAERIRVV